MKIWWTREEIVELTGFSLATIDREIRAGRLKPTRVRSSVRIRNSDLVAWLGFDWQAEQAIHISSQKIIRTKKRIIEVSLQSSLFV